MSEQLNGSAAQLSIPQVGGLTDMDMQMIGACQQEVAAALSKYKCAMVFEQQFQNGMPVAGRFVIVRASQ
jgi:hypothetical protein